VALVRMPGLKLRHGASAAVTWLVFRIIGLLSPRRRIAAPLGGAEPRLGLAFAVDPESDRIRGSLDAPVTAVEYGDIECPYCGRAEPAARELVRDFRAAAANCARSLARSFGCLT
jgi:hypothetical protein